MNGIELFRSHHLTVTEEAVQEIVACNSFSGNYGLTLSEEAAVRLAEGRMEALRRTGRIEFGGGILPKLIYALCDSPYLEQESYEETLAELQEAFYYYKNESMDSISDDELIGAMASVFNGRAQGSVDYLLATSLDRLCRYARTGYDPCDGDEAGDLF